MSRSARKEARELMRAAQHQGWTVTTTGGNHWKWISPSGSIFYSSGSPSDVHAARAVLRDLRRRGFRA